MDYEFPLIQIQWAVAVVIFYSSDICAWAVDLSLQSRLNVVSYLSCRTRAHRAMGNFPHSEWCTDTSVHYSLVALMITAHPAVLTM